VILVVAAVLVAPAQLRGGWGLNTFQALAPSHRALLVAACVILPLLAIHFARSRAVAIGLLLGGTALLAWPLREHTYFLGDATPRVGAIEYVAHQTLQRSLTGWAEGLHANPLDLGVDIVFPAWLLNHGVRGELAAIVPMMLLTPLFLLGVWRIAGLVAPRAELRLPLAAALATSGLLQAFAGYIEVTALLLTIAIWWWTTVLTPIQTLRQAAISSLLWLLLMLTHRLSIVLFPFMLWRAMGPAWQGDAPRARRALAGLGLVATALALAFAAQIGEASQLVRDARDFLAGAKSAGAGLVAPLDLISLAVILVPLAALGAWFVGPSTWRAALRSPRVHLPLIAGVVLLSVVVQVRPTGLGPYRDWDLGSLGGLCIQIAAAAALAQSSAARQRVALAWLVPALTLVAGGWVAVHADAQATVDRAIRLAGEGSSMGSFQRSQVYLYLAATAAEQQQAREAATYYTLSYELAPTPMRGFMAASYWMRLEQPDSAARIVQRLRERDALDATQQYALQRLEQAIAAARTRR